jgi:hypothetical protein
MPEPSGARGKELEGGMVADGGEQEDEKDDGKEKGKEKGSGQNDKTKQSGGGWRSWFGVANKSPTDSDSANSDEEEDSSTEEEAIKDSDANEEKVFVPVDDPTVFNKYGLANGKLLSYQLRGALRGFIDSDLAVAMAGQEAVNSAKRLMDKRDLR